MKKSSKNILISGYYGFDNFGDEAILKILTEKLKELGHKPTVLSSNPEKTSKLYDVKTIYSFDLKNIIKHIFKADLLISGGGSLLQDATSLKSLIYYLIIINLCLFFNKKVIIFAQGLGPLHNKFGAFLTKITLKRCTYLCVRDRKSKLLLKKWNINNSDLVCDPLFQVPLNNYSPKNKVGIQLRKFKTLNENYVKRLAQYVNKHFANMEIEIYSFQDSLDLEICKLFETALKQENKDIKTKIYSKLTYDEVIEHFSELKYMIAMRFHANLVSVKYGIKTLAISYDIKVEKFAEEAQIPCLFMKSDDDFDTAIKEMENENINKLTEYSNTKVFDWQKIEETING